MGCRTQSQRYHGGVRAGTVTVRGARTRARIVDAAAALVQERGVGATTVEDVRSAAGVGGSQLYHYFSGKDALIGAVADHQGDLVVGAAQSADLATVAGLWAWRDQVLAHARSTGCAGGCPLGSLGSQVAETDPEARDRVAAGFERWDAALRSGMRALHAAGHMSPGTDPDALATTVLATVQGGLLLAQVHRDPSALRTSLDTLLTLAITP